MVIENMQQTIELLKNIKDFFFNIDETEKRLNTELYNKEGERDDLLHEIELSKLNAIERMQTYSKLETVLKERRCIKDKIDLINNLDKKLGKAIFESAKDDNNFVIRKIANIKIR